MLSRAAGQFLSVDAREFANVIATVTRMLNFLNTPDIKASTEASNFNLFEALTRRKSTIYLCIPLEHAAKQSALLRLWLTSCFQAVMHGGLQEHRLVHFVLDEASMLQNFEPVKNALDRIAGFGGRLHFVFQDFGGVKKVFPDGEDQRLFAGTTKVVFGVNDYQTAELVSKMSGNETIIVEGGGSNRGWSKSYSSSACQTSDSGSTSWGTNDSWQQQKRELITPDEIMRLKGKAISFVPGMAPICTTLLRYYEEPWLTQRSNFLGGVKQRMKMLSRSIALVLILGIVSIALFEPWVRATYPIDAWIKANITGGLIQQIQARQQQSRVQPVRELTAEEKKQEQRRRRDEQILKSMAEEAAEKRKKGK